MYYESFHLIILPNRHTRTSKEKILLRLTVYLDYFLFLFVGLLLLCSMLISHQHVINLWIYMQINV